MAQSSIRAAVREKPDARGLAVIMYNTYEDDLECYGPLVPVEEDGKAMRATLNSLNFATVELKNSMKSDVENMMTAVATYPKFPVKYNCFVIYFSGHGDKGSIIVADDGEEFDYEQVIVQRFHKDVSDVAKKSQILVFVDACRGTKDPFLPKMKREDLIPSNMMIACAAGEEYSAILKNKGSVWSQKLAAALKNQKSVVEVLNGIKEQLSGTFRKEALPVIYNKGVGEAIYLAGEFVIII